MEISIREIYQVASLTLVALFVTHIGVGVYNLFFHPLSKFPGPPLWKAFRYPFVYSMWMGNLPYRVRELHEKYGSVVRTGPDELSFTSVDAWKDIYSKRESSRPSNWQGKLPGLDAHTLVSAPALDHARFRKAFASAFSEQAARQQEPLISKYIDILIQSLRQKSEMLNGDDKLLVNLAEWINFTTFDIMGDIGWGASFDCLQKESYHPWVLAVMWYKGLLLGVTLKIYPVLGKLMALITPASAKSGVNVVVETSRQNVNNRLDKPRERPDLISAILNYNKNQLEHCITQDEMITNSSTIIVAGSDPLASVVSGALTYLIKQPHALIKLETEVRSYFLSDEDISAESTKRLPYLHAVLLEALRLCTPVPDNMRRLTAPGGLIIAGHVVPGGTTVGMSAYTAFRNPAIYESPDEFLPNRWLKTGNESSKSSVFHPFGYGPRSCAGQALAWSEMRLLLTKLIWNFDISEVAPGSVRPWTDQKIYWTWQRDPLEVYLKPLELRSRK